MAVDVQRLQRHVGAESRKKKIRAEETTEKSPTQHRLLTECGLHPLHLRKKCKELYISRCLTHMAIEGGLTTNWVKVWNYYIFVANPLDMRILQKCFLYLRTITYFRELSCKCNALKKTIGTILHTELYLRLRATIGGTSEERVTINQRTALFCVITRQ